MWGVPYCTAVSGGQYLNPQLAVTPECFPAAWQVGGWTKAPANHLGDWRRRSTPLGFAPLSEERVELGHVYIPFQVDSFKRTLLVRSSVGSFRRREKLPERETEVQPCVLRGCPGSRGRSGAGLSGCSSQAVEGPGGPCGFLQMLLLCPKLDRHDSPTQSGPLPRLVSVPLGFDTPLPSSARSPQPTWDAGGRQSLLPAGGGAASVEVTCLLFPAPAAGQSIPAGPPLACACLSKHAAHLSFPPCSGFSSVVSSSLWSRTGSPVTSGQQCGRGVPAGASFVVGSSILSPTAFRITCARW